MLHKTKAIILRTTKYGETSLICQVFTEIFGLQSYLIKGVRSSRSRAQRAIILHAASELDMIVYHQPHKNFQIVKEYQVADMKVHLQQDVLKNWITLFAMEVLMQFLTQDNPQPVLFHFCKSYLHHLCHLASGHLSNMPLFFLLQAGKLSGYQVSGIFSDNTPHIDLQEGRFSETQAHFPPFIDLAEVKLMSSLNQSEAVADIIGVKMDNITRRNILHNFLAFFRLHEPHFRELKSLPVLSAILS